MHGGHSLADREKNDSAGWLDFVTVVLELAASGSPFGCNNRAESRADSGNSVKASTQFRVEPLGPIGAIRFMMD